MIVSVFHEVVDEFPGVWPRAASGLEDERDKVDVWISVKFVLLSPLCHVSWAGAGCGNKTRAAGERSNNGNIKVRGGTVEVKDKVHARTLPLTVHDAGESWHLLFNEHLGAPV